MSGEHKILIIGIGGTGVRVVSRLASSGIPDYDYAAIDSDRSALEQAAPGVRRVYVGDNWAWREGSGCGGDVLRGEQAVAPHRAEISEVMKQHRLVIVAAGLGGGLATGGIRTLASVAGTLNMPTVFMLTTPFVFESFARRKVAQERIDELLPIADVVIRIPNDLLFCQIPPDTPVEQAFDLSCTEMARSLVGTASILNAEHTLNADFDGFMAMLRNRKCHCGFGVGLAGPADGDRCTEAVKRMLQSPFLGGVQRLEEADKAIISVCGGPDLQIGEVKRCLENVTELFPARTSLISGFSTAEYMRDTVQVSVITVSSEEKEPEKTPAPDLVLNNTEQPVPEEKPKSKRARRKEEKNKLFTEVDLPLLTYSKGIFANTNAGMWNNVDLDIPTYQRPPEE